MAADNNDGKKIQLNRKMRMWNKYKNIVIGVVSVIVIVAIVAAVLKIGSIGRNDNSGQTATADKNNSTMMAEATTQQAAQADTEKKNTDQTTTQATTAASTGSVVKITDKADEEEYTSQNSFSDTVLFGDMIIAGIEDYGYLTSSTIVSDNNLTTDKALNYVSDVKDKNPSKVYVLVGLNDLNYGTRTADNVAERIGALVSSLKESLPSAKIYVVSLLPITENFESKSSVKIKQTNIDEVNKKLAESSASMGMTFIDIADAFKDGSGYLNTKFSTGGYNLNHNYYPFFLNKLAGAAK